MEFKNSLPYKGARLIKRKFRNYFSDQGMITRFYRQELSKFDPIIKVSLRKKIYKKLLAQANPNILKIVQDLELKGYAFVKLDDLGMDVKSAFDYCLDISNDFAKNNAINQNYKENFPKGVYAGKTISYRIYQKTPQQDPMMQLALHDKLISISSLYLKYLPVVEELSLVYNPIHQDKQFGSQLWHRDCQQRRILKLFFSPVEIMNENGPFEFFPPSLSTLQFYHHYPQGMTDKQLEECGLDLNCAIKFLAKPGEFLLVDTVRCLHRGAMTKKPRFMCTISYSSPLYSFARSEYKNTGTYQFSFVEFKKENEDLLSRYAKMI